jgi:hypothetical protein
VTSSTYSTTRDEHRVGAAGADSYSLQLASPSAERSRGMACDGRVRGPYGRADFVATKTDDARRQRIGRSYEGSSGIASGSSDATKPRTLS